MEENAIINYTKIPENIFVPNQIPNYTPKFFMLPNPIIDELNFKQLLQSESSTKWSEENSIFRKKIVPIKIIIQPSKYQILGKKKGRKLSKLKNEELEKFKGKKKIFEIKIHSRNDVDNIMRKIKVYYHNFLLIFINKCIETEVSKKYKLKKISSKITQDISISFNKNLFNKTLKEFFSSKISKKYACASENDEDNENKNKINTISKSEKLNNLLSLTYLFVYENFFINEKTYLIDSKFIPCYNESPNLERIIQDLKTKEQNNIIQKNLIDNNNNNDNNISEDNNNNLNEESEKVDEIKTVPYWEKVKNYAKNLFVKKILTTRERKCKNVKNKEDILYSEKDNKSHEEDFNDYFKEKLSKTGIFFKIENI